MTGIKDYYLQINKQVQVEIPEWNKTVYVGPLTIGQYQKIEAAMELSDSERNLSIIGACAKTDEGKPAFNQIELADLRVYGTTDVVLRVAAEITKAMPDGTFDTPEGEKKG